MIQSMLNQEWIEGLIDFVFPPVCLGCGEFCESKLQICDVCLKDIEKFEHPLCLNCQSFVPKGIVCPICKRDSAMLFAYADYKQPLKNIIIQFKFKGITSPAKTFADLTYEHFKERLSGLEAGCLIPIPLYSTRENYRGYNQAELIAENLSSNLGIPVEYEALRRVKRRQPQARLNFKKRLANIKDVFEADAVDKKFDKVILVDDVVTSGATVLEAKKVLEAADQKVVGIISIAHGV